MLLPGCGGAESVEEHLTCQTRHQGARLREPTSCPQLRALARWSRFVRPSLKDLPIRRQFLIDVLPTCGDPGRPRAAVASRCRPCHHLRPQCTRIPRGKSCPSHTSDCIDRESTPRHADLRPGRRDIASWCIPGNGGSPRRCREWRAVRIDPGSISFQDTPCCSSRSPCRSH